MGTRDCALHLFAKLLAKTFLLNLRVLKGFCLCRFTETLTEDASDFFLAVLFLPSLFFSVSLLGLMQQKQHMLFKKH